MWKLKLHKIASLFYKITCWLEFYLSVSRIFVRFNSISQITNCISSIPLCSNSSHCHRIGKTKAIQISIGKKNKRNHSYKPARWDVVYCCPQARFQKILPHDLQLNPEMDQGTAQLPCNESKRKAILKFSSWAKSVKEYRLQMADFFKIKIEFCSIKKALSLPNRL